MSRRKADMILSDEEVLKKLEEQKAKMAELLKKIQEFEEERLRFLADWIRQK